MGKLLEELIGLGIVSAILYETKSTEKGRKSKPLLSWDDDYDKDQIANYADAEKERIVCGVPLLNDRVSKGRSPKSVSLQCRCCNARMEISNHTQALFCPHCGTGNLIIEDSSVKNAGGKDIAYRAAESGKRKANAGIAAERKKKSGNSNPDAVVVLQEFVLAIVILAVLVVLVFPTLMRETDSDRSTHTDEIQIPGAYYEYAGEKCIAVVTELQRAGFTNVRMKGLNDLKLGILKKDGTVDKIYINGRTGFREKTWFPSNAEVVVTYHCFQPD